jgi:hypothetical protein
MPALHTANESGALTAALVILIWALVVLFLFGAIVWWQAHPGTRPARIEHWNLLSERPAPDPVPQTRRSAATAVPETRGPEATVVLNAHLPEYPSARTAVLPRVPAQNRKRRPASTSMTSSAR